MYGSLHNAYCTRTLTGFLMYAKDLIETRHKMGTKNRKKHSAQIRVNYQGSRVHIEYLSSQYLKYGVKRGQEVIHRRYNQWAKAVERDVRTELARIPGSSFQVYQASTNQANSGRGSLNRSNTTTRMRTGTVKGTSISSQRTASSSVRKSNNRLTIRVRP